MSESNIVQLFQTSNFIDLPVKFFKDKQTTTCVQSKGLITVLVPNTEDFMDAVEFTYGPRVGKILFREGDRTSVTFSLTNWFAVEFYNIVDKLSSQGMMSHTCGKIKKSLMKDTWLKNTVGKPKKPHLDLSLPAVHLKWDLHPHQLDYINWYNDTVRSYGLIGSLMGFTMGGGKTMTAIAVAVAAKSERVIVLCPKPAIPSPWKSYHKKIYKNPPSIWAPDSKEDLKEDTYLIVANFDYIEKLIIKLSKFKQVPTTVILDESHNFNTETAGRTVSFLKLMGICDVTDVLFLTGTPIKAKHTELITLFRSIDPYFTPEVEVDFLALYKFLRGNIYGLLSRRLGINSYIVEKKTLNLTDTTTQEIHLEVENGERYEVEHIKERMVAYSKKRIKELMKARPKNLEKYWALIAKAKKGHTNEHATYVRCAKTLIASTSYTHLKEEMKFCNKYEKTALIPELRKTGLQKDFRAVRSFAKYPALSVLGEALGRVLGRYRIEAAQALAKAAKWNGIIESSLKKTLIFTNSTEVVEDVMRYVKPFKGVPVYGRYTKDMASIVNRINKEPSANPIIATFASLSTAVPLPIVSHVVIIDAPFRSYILGQALARAHRLGQDDPVTFTYLHMITDLPNVLERSLDLAKWSADESSRILNIEVPIVFPESVMIEIKDEEEMSKEDYESYYDVPTGGIF